jgi:hypothetical protein
MLYHNHKSSSKTITTNYSISDNVPNNYVIKNTTSFETPIDELEHNQEYIKLNKILKDLNIKL